MNTNEEIFRSPFLNEIDQLLSIIGLCHPWSNLKRGEFDRLFSLVMEDRREIEGKKENIPSHVACFQYTENSIYSNEFQGTLISQRDCKSIVKRERKRTDRKSSLFSLSLLIAFFR